MPRKNLKTQDRVLGTAEPSPSLAELCTEAADHVAQARLALFDSNCDVGAALLHLDEAIACLKRLLAHGRSAYSD